jgi:hypothetical protein
MRIYRGGERSGVGSKTVPHEPFDASGLTPHDGRKSGDFSPRVESTPWYVPLSLGLRFDANPWFETSAKRLGKFNLPIGSADAQTLVGLRVGALTNHS